MPTRKFKGTSKGNFQEALDKAIAKAENSTGGADIIIKWVFISAIGEKGGIAGKISLTVTIEATW